MNADEPQSNKSSEDVWWQRQLDHELQRLYPAVCVPDSEERTNFLRVLASGGKGEMRNVLRAAYESLGGGNAAIPLPCSPIVQPATLEEQLCYIRLWEVEIHNTAALEVFEFLVGEAKRICTRMHPEPDPPDLIFREEIDVRFCVPMTVLTNHRLSWNFQGTTLGQAFRLAAESIGLAVRLMNGSLLICSEDVAAALDSNARHGYQSPLWEVRPGKLPSTHGIRDQDYAGICRTYPQMADQSAPEAVRFMAHFLLGGTPENAWSIADRLFLCQQPATETPQPAEIPGIDPEPPETE